MLSPPCSMHVQRARVNSKAMLAATWLLVRAWGLGVGFYLHLTKVQMCRNPS
jgi:hypothetical protein